MVGLEELEALDLLVWLQSGITAGEVVGSSQSTISRRAQRVLRTFQAQLLRGQGGWSLATPLDSLLNLQRQIHQQYRFRGYRGLRLDVPAWSRPVMRRCPLHGWLLTPEIGPLVCHDPLRLLRDHVLDACLVTPTQLRGQSLDGLVCFELYSSPIDLYTRRAADAPDPERPDRSEQACLDLLARSSLRLLPFLPASCREASRERYDALLDHWRLPRRADHGPATCEVSFLTPVMARGQSDLQRLNLSCDWPYCESLLVLAGNAEQPAIQELVTLLRHTLPRVLTSLLPESLVSAA